MGIAGIRSAKKSLVVQDTSMPVEKPCKQITELTALHVKEAMIVLLKTSHRRQLSSFVFLSWNAEDVSIDGVARGSRSKP